MKLIQSVALFILISQIIATQYKPVILYHGVADTPGEMDFFADTIRKEHPNQTVYQMNILHGFSSYLTLWFQVDIYQEKTREIMRKHPEGVHLIGYSQGGLIARGVIQTTSDHNVDTFISIIAPQMGLYGKMEDGIGGIGRSQWLLENIYKLFYSSLGQKISISNFWRDPKHINEYLTQNKFLPYLNNEVRHSCSKKFKKNLIKLNKFVLIGLSDDNVLNPWDTSQFGSYDENGQKIVLRNQTIYQDDRLGLRTLDERGSLHLLNFSGVAHQKLQFNETFIKTCVLPWLT